MGGNGIGCTSNGQDDLLGHGKMVESYQGEGRNMINRQADVR